MDPRRHRRLLVLLGAGFVAVVIAVVVFYPSGSPDSLPAPLEAVSPLPGEAVVGQVTIEIDLPIGYAIDLVVDGVPVPPAEIIAVEGLGSYRWYPGPGRVIERWEQGEHTIEVSWDSLPGRRPDPGAFSWRFRVT
ncbi:MAG: hypothetical protein HZA58_05880 [Acidimicrobiia bacterium]|nr:hypothetical protein [Acidimicrobiia bacterium]